MNHLLRLLPSSTVPPSRFRATTAKPAPPAAPWRLHWDRLSRGESVLPAAAFIKQGLLAAATLQLAPERIPFPNPHPLTVHLACIRVPQGRGRWRRWRPCRRLQTSCRLAPGW
jgi:hypothetical protein